MKKWIVFTLVASFLGADLFAQELVIEGEYPVLEENLTLQDKDIIISKYSVDLSKVKGRLLSEVNDTEGTDAYPFLSNDGLRLYWTQSTGGDDHFVCASRTNVNEKFSTPKKVAFNYHEKSVMSCWLTKDELTIFYVAIGGDRVLMKATRASKNVAFENPVALTLLDKRGTSDIGFFAAPSLTQDESELFLYTSNDEEMIRHFKRDENNIYVELGHLMLDKHVTPGQLAADGLSYTLSIGHEGAMVVFRRNGLGEVFEKDEVVDLGADFHQITHNGDIMVMGFSTDDSWARNELYIGEYPVKKEVPIVAEAKNSQRTTTAEIKQLEISSIDIFPNPAADFITICFEAPARIQTIQIDLLTTAGKVVQTIQHDQKGVQNAQLSVVDLAAGNYVCRLSAKGMKTVSRVIAVQ